MTGPKHSSCMLMPSKKYLWCNDIDTARLNSWLHSHAIQHALPCWFYGSFLNYCKQVIDKTKNPCSYPEGMTNDEQRTSSFLSSWPMDSDALIDEMKWYRLTKLGDNQFFTGVVNLENAG